MSTIRIVVKPTSGGTKIEKDIETSLTVREVKESLAEQCSIPADDQRLIYKGQILRDERTVESYGIGNDHVLHLVRGKPTGNTQSSGGASASTPAAAAGATPGAAAGAAGAAGGLPSPLGALGVDPAAMQQMMQSPIMQQLMNNPEFMRNMLQMNPAVRDLMDRDPQMAQLLNNPELLRDSMNLMSNPNLMREYMRNNDRALSNIEALPGGFNALRQLYENVQEPLLNATTGPGSNPFASLLQGGAGAGSAAAGTGSSATSTSGSGAGAAAGAGDQPGSQPLPNPWAAPGSAAAGGAAGGALDAPRGLGGPGLGRGLDLSAMLGAGGLGSMGAGAGGAEAAARMMEDPQLRETMISMMSQPGMLDMLAASNPQINQLMNAMPGMRDMMQNPELLRSLLNPELVRSAMQGMGGAGAAAGGGAGPAFNPAMLASMLSGAGGAGAGAAGSGSAAGGAGGGLEGLMGMLNAMQMGGMGLPMGLPMGGLGLPTPVADPATTYATQIQQLQDMGFYDQEANVRALQATGGNVNAAVDRLLQGFP